MVAFNNSQLGYFDRNVLRLEPERREKFESQVDHLIARLRAKIDEDSSFKVVRFRKAGSFAKATVLRPRDGVNVDADVAVYLNLDEADAGDVDRLHQIIRDLMVAVYPSKESDDVIVQPRTLCITFRTSGLDVDLVPIVEIPDHDGYGWQPSSQGESPVLTSVPGQIEFVRSRHKADSRYRPLVRMVKQWRNRQTDGYPAIKKLGSYAIELILGHIQDTQGPSEGLQQGLNRFFLFVVRGGLRRPITFPENGAVPTLPQDPAVILDPVNFENNVLRRVTDAELDGIEECCNASWEWLNRATHNDYKGETIAFWRRMFGPSFRVEA